MPAAPRSAPTLQRNDGSPIRALVVDDEGPDGAAVVALQGGSGSRSGGHGLSLRPLPVLSQCPPCESPMCRLRS